MIQTDGKHMQMEVRLGDGLEMMLMLSIGLHHLKSFMRNMEDFIIKNIVENVEFVGI